jgi:hypothetical protein
MKEEDNEIQPDEIGAVDPQDTEPVNHEGIEKISIDDLMNP